MRTKWVTMLFYVLPVLPLPAFSQEVSIGQNQLLLVIDKLENASESYNFEFINKLFRAVYFDHYFNKRLSGFVGFGYGNYGVVDESNIVVDAFIGKGDLREFSLSMGIRYRLRGESTKHVCPMFSTALFYSRTNYSGQYHGGEAGESFSVDKNTRKAGVEAGFGLEITVLKRWVILPSLSLRMGPASAHDLIADRNDAYFYVGLVPIELSMGLRF